MEKNMKKNVYIYMYNGITLLYRRTEHNTVNQLHFNKILKKQKNKDHIKSEKKISRSENENPYKREKKAGHSENP